MQKAIKIEYRVKCGPKEKRFGKLYYKPENPTLYENFLLIIKTSNEVDPGIMFNRKNVEVDSRIEVFDNAAELANALIARESEFKHLKVAFCLGKEDVSVFYVKNNGIVTLERIREFVRGCNDIQFFVWEYVANVPANYDIFDDCDAVIDSFRSQNDLYQFTVDFFKHSCGKVIITDKGFNISNLVKFISKAASYATISMEKVDSASGTVYRDAESAFSKLHGFL